MPVANTELANVLGLLRVDPEIIKVARRASTYEWQELLQEVFYDLCCNMHRVVNVFNSDGLAGVVHYIGRCLRNAAKNSKSTFRRNIKPCGQLINEDINTIPNEYEPDFCVSQIVERLEPKSADLLILYAETKSYRKAAAALNCAPMTAYRGIQKAQVEAKKLIP